jgi:hypothetical protein
MAAMRSGGITMREERKARPTAHPVPFRLLPLLLISIGAILLVNNLGIVPWSIWPVLARLWPVLLIVAGLDLLLEHHGRWVSLLTAIAAVIIVTATAVAILRFHDLGSAAAEPASARTTTVPLDGAARGQVTVHLAAGQLTMGALPSGATSLLAVNSQMPSGMQMASRVERSNGTATVTLQGEGRAPGLWFLDWIGPRDGIRWTVQLARATPLTLEVNLGAGRADLDLSELAVQELTLDSGAGDLTVTFPAGTSRTDAEIRSGAGHLTLIIPPEVGARLHAPAEGIVKINAPGDRFHQTTDGYESSNYASAAHHLEITLHLGVGSVDVR